MLCYTGSEASAGDHGERHDVSRVGSDGTAAGSGSNVTRRQHTGGANQHAGEHGVESGEGYSGVHAGWGWRDTHNNDIGTTLAGGSERTALRKPVAVGVIGDPINDGFLFVGGNALVGVANSLEDVVDVLGDTENARPRLGHCGWMSDHVAERAWGSYRKARQYSISSGKLTIPSQIDTHQAGESDEGVAHQGDTTTLRSGAEESDLGLSLTKLLGVLHKGPPG